jgi:hypothetical protein
MKRMSGNPPISELGLTIVFRPIDGLTVLDLASVFEVFSGDFPVLQQVPVVPHIPLAGDIPTIQFNQFGMGAVGAPLPRLWIVALDSKTLVQF